VKALFVLLVAGLSLGGCATIKGWFVSTPEEPPGEPAALATPVPPIEAPEEPKPTPAAPASAPRAVPTPPEPSKARVPVPPRPASITPPPAAPAPAAPRTTPEPSPPPPPVLSPVLSAVDEQKLRMDTQSRIDGVEQRLRQIDPTKLASAQQESLQTVQSFLDKAREALQTQDVQRAFILADKAYLLADELTKR